MTCEWFNLPSDVVGVDPISTNRDLRSLFPYALPFSWSLFNAHQFVIKYSCRVKNAALEILFALTGTIGGKSAASPIITSLPLTPARRLAEPPATTEVVSIQFDAGVVCCTRGTVSPALDVDGVAAGGHVCSEADDIFEERRQQRQERVILLATI